MGAIAINMTSSEVMQDALKNSGGTYYLDAFGEEFRKSELTTGYMVSREGMERKIPLAAFERFHVDAFIDFRAPELSEENAYFGIWIDGDYVYLDVSEHFEDKGRALIAGHMNGQLAIWDIAAGEAITL